MRALCTCHGNKLQTTPCRHLSAHARRASSIRNRWLPSSYRARSEEFSFSLIKIQDKVLLNNSLVIPSRKNYLSAKIFSPFYLSDVIAEYDHCPMTTEKANVHSIALDLLRTCEDSGSIHCGCSCLLPRLSYYPLSSGPLPVGGFALDDAPLLGMAYFWEGCGASRLGPGLSGEATLCYVRGMSLLVGVPLWFTGMTLPDASCHTATAQTEPRQLDFRAGDPAGTPGACCCCACSLRSSLVPRGDEHGN